MIEIRFSGLRQNKPHEYLVRFVFGGAATLAAGLIAMHCGPALGGLFLAFPAIFPASATLIESHEKKRKNKIGRDGSCRGRLAASLDSAGAALGAIGLFAFAFVLWRLLPGHNAWLIVLAAMAIWTAVAYACWWIRRHRYVFRRARPRRDLSR